MADGYQARRSDTEEMLAHYFAFIANAWSKQTIRTEDVLGRPLRRAWKEAMDKKKADTTEGELTTADRLAQKDAERLRRNLRSQRGK